LFLFGVTTEAIARVLFFLGAHPLAAGIDEG
jgi:hypothetical protein